MSTTETADLTDLELFLLVDFEFESPCDGRPHITTCDHAAEWEALLSCGCTRLWCDDHLQGAQNFIATGGMTCSTCHNKTGTWNPTTILYIQPAGKGH